MLLVGPQEGQSFYKNSLDLSNRPSVNYVDRLCKFSVHENRTCSYVLYDAMILDLMFLETSALNGENVEEAFLKCTRTILAKIESGKPISVYHQSQVNLSQVR